MNGQMNGNGKQEETKMNNAEVGGSREVVNGEVESSVARASRDVVDLGKTTGQSPGSREVDLLIKVHLVNAKEMAEILKVPLSAIYEHTRKKTIPHVRFGKYCRFDPAEVIAHFKRAADAKQQK